MCGFIAVLGPEGQHVIQDVLTGLLAIQHRGQDAAGVVSFEGKFHARKARGLVREVFEERHLERLRGNLAVGHVRYPTVGSGSEADAQPFWLQFPTGIAMAHNGNVTNFHELRRTQLADRAIPLASDCDLEAILYVFADELCRRLEGGAVEAQHIYAAARHVFEHVRGAYSVVGIVAGWGLFAFRDPYGIKPIVLGRRDGPGGPSFAVASESVVLEVAGYERVRDLAAGEALWIGRDREPRSEVLAARPHRPCVFEYVYFARPDSVLDGVSVHAARRRLGQALAEPWRRTGLEADVVIPVPESACTAAQALAEALGVPYREGFVKNRYVGRTFIMPSDAERVSSIRHKLNPIRSEFAGKRVLILDDSIVRGNTSRQIAKIARDMGATKVYMASYSPPLVHPCLYGIDMSTRREFVARGRTAEDVARLIGADHLLYQSVEDMVAAVRGDHADLRFCRACFDGAYPTGDVTARVLETIEDERLAAQ
ncbi:MAG: amidophosphoribosyltransferase [Planctomycetota bacterium]|nr:MAG: amidophosphoribosyltransferase [Planctomycetota bacterium]